MVFPRWLCKCASQLVFLKVGIAINSNALCGSIIIEISHIYFVSCVSVVHTILKWSCVLVIFKVIEQSVKLYINSDHAAYINHMHKYNIVLYPVTKGVKQKYSQYICH